MKHGYVRVVANWQKGIDCQRLRDRYQERLAWRSAHQDLIYVTDVVANSGLIDSCDRYVKAFRQHPTSQSGLFRSIVNEQWHGEYRASRCANSLELVEIFGNISEGFQDGCVGEAAHVRVAGAFERQCPGVRPDPATWILPS